MSEKQSYRTQAWGIVMMMVEKMARAAWAEYAGIPQVREDWMDDEDWQEDHIDAMARWPDNAGTHIGAEGFRECARAALAAMMEPSDAMNVAGFKEDSRFLRSHHQTYQAMIQAALDESQGLTATPV
jgi:hypothetical protein